MTSEYNTDWSSVPDTNPNAKPTAYRQVKHVLAVLVHEGFLRGSKFNDCYFEVADSKEPFDTFAGKTRVEVKALWFGILVLMTVSFGLIAPPVGLNVYVVNSLARDVPMRETYQGLIPFLAWDLSRMVVLLMVPSLSLWLVGQLFTR